MSSVSIPGIQGATAQIIRRANKSGTLGDLTPRLVRRKVEEELAIEIGILDDIEYKDVVKDALAEAMARVEDNAENEAGRTKPSDEPSVKKSAAKSRKRKSQEGDKPEAVAVKSKDIHASGAKSSKKSAGKAAKSARSASIVPSSDDEGNKSQPKIVNKAKLTSQVNPPPKPTKKSAKGIAAVDGPEGDGTPPKKRRKKVVTNDDEEEGSREERATSSVHRPVDSSIGVDGNVSVSSPKKKAVDGDRSDSGMSVLIDEVEPTRKRKKNDTTAAASSVKKRMISKKEPQKRKTKESEELSKDDQEIKRLKGFVVACGVRKVWAKEFKDMDKLAQIHRLKQILADLGMKGRLSLEQARSIRSKRELAQELQDVQEFEKSVVSGPSRRSSRGTTKLASTDHAGDSEDELSDVPPVNTARKKIMAFLEDQSDDE